MRAFAIFLFSACLALNASLGLASKGIPATMEDISRLREDIRQGKIIVGQTRLNDIQNNYGNPNNIVDADKKVTYDYGDIKVEFDKKKYWKSWKYNSDKKPAYTVNSNKIRQDLEGEKLYGKLITLEKIYKDYEEPTDSVINDDDGGLSFYYYGDIELTFENIFTVKNVQGKDLNRGDDAGVKKTAPQAIPAVPSASSAKSAQ